MYSCLRGIAGWLCWLRCDAAMCVHLSTMPVSLAVKTTALCRVRIETQRTRSNGKGRHIFKFRFQELFNSWAISMVLFDVVLFSVLSVICIAKRIHRKTGVPQFNTIVEMLVRPFRFE